MSFYLNLPYFSIKLPENKNYSGLSLVSNSNESDKVYTIELLPEKKYVYSVPNFSADYSTKIIKINSNFVTGSIVDNKIYISDQEKITDFWANIKLIVGLLSPFFPLFFLHSSVGTLENTILIFSGPSESGKSTAQKLLNTDIINEDCAFIDTKKGELLFNPFEYETMFKNNYINNNVIKYLFFIERKDENKIQKISSFQEKLVKLLENITIFSKDKFYFNKILDRINEFINNDIDFYRISYIKEDFKSWFINEIQNK